VQDEIDILNTMDHKHIIKLHNHFETKKFIYLVEEYANAGTLYKELQRSKDKKIPEAQALKWIK
jgi:serine/threonine protein kinase